MPQQQRDLKELQKLIEEKRKVAFRDTSGWPAETKGGVEAAKNAAQQDMIGLLKEVDGAVAAQGLIISVEGPAKRVESFLKTVRDASDADVCILDADACYRVIAGPVRESMGKSGTFNSTQVALAIGGLRTVAVELGITEFQRPDFAGITAVYITDSDTLVREIKRVVRGAGGDDLAAMYVHRQAVNFATDNKFKSQQMPIFIKGGGKDLSAALATKFATKPASIVIEDDEPISKTSVLKALAQIKKQARETPEQSQQQEQPQSQ